MPQSYIFDGINKIIQLENTSSFTILDAYSRWKDYVITGSNAKYLSAFSYVGGEPTVGSDSLGITYFLLNGWRFRPYNSVNHRLQVEGNIFTTEGSSSFIFPTGSFSVLIENKISNLKGTTVSLLSPNNEETQLKIQELWQLHGLDYSGSLNVTQTQRTFAGISQSISTVGTGSLQETTITRL